MTRRHYTIILLLFSFHISTTSALVWSPGSLIRTTSAKRLFVPGASSLKMSGEGQNFDLKKSLRNSLGRVSRMMDQVKDGDETDLKGLGIKESSIYIFLYLVFGVGAYSFILPERWPIVQSLYFCVCTLTTIGHGDVVPTAQVSKLFTCLFACGGIAFWILAVASIGSKLIEGELRDQAKAEVGNRLSFIEYFGNAIKQQIEERKEKIQTNDNGPKDTPVVLTSLGSKLKIKKAVTAFVSVLSIGGTILGFLEGWSFIDSLYYSLMTSVTLGYGDFTPTMPLTRIFAVLYYPLAVAASGNVFGSIAAFLLNRRRDKVYQRNLCIDQINAMDADKNGEVSKDEYITFMLVELQLVDQDIVDKLDAQFDQLDVTGDGCLCEKDIVTAINLKRQQVELELANSTY